MDWRATASAQVQDDLDGLLRDSVNAVARMLGTADSFNPFMLVIDEAGAKSMRLAPHGIRVEGEAGMIGALQIRGDRANLRARVTVFDVRVTGQFDGDAIKAVLEHRDGVAINVLVPYTVTVESVAIELDSANGAPGVQQLWGDVVE